MTWAEVTEEASTWLSDDGLFYVLNGYIVYDYFNDGQSTWTELTNDTTTWVTV
jgi:hypothetical protein